MISFENRLSSQSKEGLGRTKLGLGIAETTNYSGHKIPLQNAISFTYGTKKLVVEKTILTRSKDNFFCSDLVHVIGVFEYFIGNLQ